MLRPLRIVALAAVITASVAGIAIACSCRPIRSAEEHVALASAIFRGRVVETVQDEGSSLQIGTTTFELTAPLLMPSQWGAPPDRIEVRHDFTRDGPQCSIWYAPGEEVLVIASMGQGHQLYTSSCMAPRYSENEYRAALHLTPAGE